MSDTLKQRWARGETIMACAFGRIVHHVYVQQIGIHGGFQAIWFDLEHMDYSTERLEVGCLAARAIGMDTFVRLAPTDYATITRALEAGATGVMAAQVRTAAQAEEFVKWAKFYPRGYRGLNTAGWDARYATIPATQFAEKANRETFVLIQIETLEALNDCEAIAAIDGVDGLFVGPADLGQALGVTGDFFNPKCLAALEKVGAACKKANKPWGVVPVNQDYADRCVSLGCRLLSCTNDVRCINVGIDAVKKSYGKYFPAAK